MMMVQKHQKHTYTKATIYNHFMTIYIFLHISSFYN